jgi:hypothetical protein
VWYEGEMIIGGVWYQKMATQKGQITSYVLLRNSTPTFAYSHLVLNSKFSMLPSATHKDNPNFSIPSDVKEILIASIEEKETCVHE